jgi:hypothetical protein
VPDEEALAVPDGLDVQLDGSRVAASHLKGKQLFSNAGIQSYDRELRRQRCKNFNTTKRLVR